MSSIAAHRRCTRQPAHVWPDGLTGPAALSLFDCHQASLPSECCVSASHTVWECRARVSNTGCIVHQSLRNSHLLLKGHAPHDREFNRLCSEDPSTTVAILWPSADALTPAQVLELARARSGATRRGMPEGTPASRDKQQGSTEANGVGTHTRCEAQQARSASCGAGGSGQGGLILVAVDANWPGARRMMKAYEETLQDRFVKLALPAGEVFAPGQDESMLASIRKYRPQDGSFEHRCDVHCLHQQGAGPHQTPPPHL